MNLSDIANRRLPPEPWAEGENIPWNDEEFSRRMLAEHLNQKHNLASRNSRIIERQVGWIHERILGGRPARILDLACGPGLYTSRLANMGHDCVGIDFAPAAIDYARKQAGTEDQGPTYRLEDIRRADFGCNFDLVMLLFGQFNVFRRNEARDLLEKARGALSPGALIILEAQRYATVEKSGRSGSSWYSCGPEGGLFSDRPHLCLSEAFWDPELRTATQRFFIIDAESGAVSRWALSNEGYIDEEFRGLLTKTGFGKIRFYPSLIGKEVEEESQAANLVLVARKMV